MGDTLNFKDYLKTLLKDDCNYLYGCFSHNSLNKFFFITDLDFNIIFESQAFDNNDNFTKEVIDVAKEYNISNLHQGDTYNDIEDLKKDMEVKYSLYLLSNTFTFPDMLKNSYFE